MEAEGTGRVGAIGILGSDVYDKLLILRALRPQFPNTLFFTTDLDAQLLHPADFPWTRNLIVASSFGLDLNRKLQGKIPPFRGNYQTSIFFSTLLATEFDYPYGLGQSSPDISIHDELMQRMPPLLFEVGRHGAERLGPVPKASDTVHPFLPESPVLRNTVYVFLIILLLIGAAHQSRPFSGWLVFWSFLALLLAMNMAFVAIVLSDGGEPMSLTHGISVWPTEFIRYAALCLSVYFISLLIIDLRANGARISRDMLNITGNRYDTAFGYDSALAKPATLTDLWKLRGNWLFAGVGVGAMVLAGSYATVSYGREYLWMPQTFILCLVAVLILFLLFCCKRVPWIVECIPAVVLGAIGIPLTQKYGAVHFWFPPVYWFLALGLWFFLIYRLYPRAYRVASINSWMRRVMRRKNAAGVDARDYWLAYW